MAVNSEQRWLVIRLPYGRPSFSIEYGEPHRCHTDKGREPETTKRLEIPIGWKGTLRDIVKHYQSRIIGKQ